MGMTLAKWQEFISKSKQMRKQATLKQQVSNWMQKRADWTLPGGSSSYLNYQNPSGGVGLVNEVKEDQFGSIAKNNDAEMSAQLQDPEYWKNLPEATMRGLANSGWSTVRGANNLVLRGIPAASGALRNGSYAPIMATIDAANNGDMGNWWDYYGKQLGQTKQDMDIFYTPARAVENYVNEVQQYGNEHTWADSRGADYNKYYSGYEKAVEFAGDMAQVYGFTTLAQAPGKAGKVGNGLWRMTGDPVWQSDVNKGLGFIAQKAPKAAPVIEAYQTATKNPILRNSIVTVAKDTPFETPARIMFAPGSYGNQFINEQIADASSPIPSYYQGMPEIETPAPRQRPRVLASTMTNNPPVAARQPNFQGDIEGQFRVNHVNANYQPMQASTPTATRVTPQQGQRMLAYNGQSQSRNNSNTNAANNAFNRQPTANGGTVTRGTNFTNTRDANGRLKSVTAGNTQPRRI